MKTFIQAFIVTFALFLGAAHAQSSTSNANSGSNSTSAVQAANANAQTIEFTSPGHQTVRAAPALAVGSYGTSFSADGCMNTAQIGATVVGTGVVAGKSVRDDVCSRIRLSYAWGQYAKYLNDTGRKDTEAQVAGMIAWQLCSAGMSGDEEQCKKLGLTK